MFAVASPKHNTMYFLEERPEVAPDLVIEDGVEMAPIGSAMDATWPLDAKRPDRVLCRSRTDPKFYKLFKYRDEVNPAEFEETGKNFGGLMSREQWIKHRREVEERVRRWAETAKILESITDETDADEAWDDDPFNLDDPTSPDQAAAR